MSQTLAMANGDLYVQPNGQLLLIDGPTKTDQDIAETLLQPFDITDGSGCRINDLVGRPVEGVDAVLAVTAEQYVTEAILELRNKQQQNPQTMSSELIAGIARIVVREGKKRGDVFYFVQVAIADGSKVNGSATGFKVSINQAAAPFLRELVESNLPIVE